ncbi:MAG: sulfatase-like hydrolase/transferase [Holophagales bacterium]|nr:sulfatase-like hydrolase/transferase [Holophagales bacterium]
MKAARVLDGCAADGILHRGMQRALVQVAAVVVAGLSLVPVVGCSRAKSAAPSPRFPNAPVVLICVDTLRSDRLPMYGYAKVATPAFDALRKDAVLFEHAYSHVPLTLPAHASLFTGLEPGGHGVLDNSGYRLAASDPTLAALLKGAGYATGGAISAAVLASPSGISRGFDFYEERVEARGAVSMLDFVERPGGDTAALLLGWVRQNSARPFFAFLHTYEPHAPYLAPEPFRSRYADPYDAEVAASDAIVGEFLEGLRKDGLYDRALILFLSDHGEGLGDHGEQQHGIFLYRESIQVPLLVKLPGRALAGSSVAAPVQLTDVFTTIGDVLGLADFPGRPGTVSLTDLAAGEPAPARRVFAENFSPRIRLGWSELRALVSERHHYIEAPTPELYDLVDDPGEKVNLASRRPPELRAMVVETERRRTALRAPAPADAETAKKLQALGYLTGTARDDGGARPDPKDAIGSLVRLQQAAELHTAGRSAEAVPILLEVLAANPRLVDGWEILSSALERLGRMEEALAALKKTVALSPPGRSNYVVNVASLALRAGRLDEARRHAELARDLGDTRAYVVLGRVFLREGRLAEALRAADEGLSRAGGAPPEGLHVVRAEVFGRQEKLDEAEAEHRLELAAHPRNVEALSGLAIVAAARGDLAEAARRVAAMVRAVPTAEAYLAGYFSLRSFGQAGEARALLAEGRRAFPLDPFLAREEAAGPNPGKMRR